MISTSMWATPDEVVFIFLSENNSKALLDRVNEKLNIKFYSKIAQNTEDCVEVGEDCFHPQLGLYRKKGANKKLAPKKPKNYKLKTFNSFDVNLVSCDKNYYFDMFCGKDKKISYNQDTEIWIDTSSSFKIMDYSSDGKHCKRRSFTTKILDKCGRKNVLVSTFDTSKKILGGLDNLCMSYGNNNTGKLIDWIKGSKTKYLIVVTDINELSEELREYLDSIGAKFYGADRKSVTAANLEKFSTKFTKSCKKI